MKVLFPYIKKYRWDAIWSVVAIFVVAFATLWQPHLLQIIMNAIMKMISKRSGSMACI